MSTPNDQTEREMQEWVEKGMHETSVEPRFYDKADAAAYDFLYDVLKEKPVVELSPDFAGRLVTNLEVQHDRVFNFRWNLVLPLSVFLIVSIFYLISLYINPAQANVMLQLIIRFKWHIVFIMGCFFIVQYLDQVLIKKRLLDTYS